MNVVSRYQLTNSRDNESIYPFLIFAEVMQEEFPVCVVSFFLLNNPAKQNKKQKGKKKKNAPAVRSAV